MDVSAPARGCAEALILQKVRPVQRLAGCLPLGIIAERHTDPAVRAGKQPVGLQQIRLLLHAVSVQQGAVHHGVRPDERQVGVQHVGLARTIDSNKAIYLFVEGKIGT